MIAPPVDTFEAASCVLQIEGPATTQAVLEAEMWIPSELEEGTTTLIPNTRQIVHWCAHHVRGVVEQPADHKTPEEVGLPHWLDAHLTLKELLELKGQAVRLVCYQEDLLDDLQEFWKIQFRDGCQCPFCEGRASRENMVDHIEDPCKFSDLDNRVYTLAYQYEGIQDQANLLEAPYWLYQVRKRHKMAENEAMEEREDEKQKRDLAQEMLKERGIR